MPGGGGSSGGGKTQTVVQETKSNQTIPKELRPFIIGGKNVPESEAFLPRALALSQQPLLPLPGVDARIAGFSPEELQAFDLTTQRALGGSPLIQAAQAGVGQLVDPNLAFSPLADRLVQTVQGDIVDQFNLNVAPATAARFNASGAFGGTAQQELESAQRFGLARALGDVGTGVRRGFLDLALQAAPVAQSLANQDFVDLANLQQVGATRRALDQARLDVSFQNFLDRRNEEINRLGILGSAIASAGGTFQNAGVTTQTTGPQNIPGGPNPFIGGLGAAGSFLGGVGRLASVFAG